MRKHHPYLVLVFVFLGCGGGEGGAPDSAIDETVDTRPEVCVTVCSMYGNECGPDGCGGSCGNCGVGQVCNQGLCDCAFTECAGQCCGAGQGCYDSTCCTANCGGRECGSDGCGGTCGAGACAGGLQCYDGLCRPCPPEQMTQVEECNGQDDNCNEQVDEGFSDLDGDGTADCVDSDTDGDGHDALDGNPPGDDCNDEDASVFPGAVDVLGDGKDSNCDAHDGVDADQDAHASEASGGDDCDDGDAAAHPGALDKVDALHVDLNCDGADGTDADGDGYASEVDDVSGDDCNDGDASVHPGLVDVLGDGEDSNCDVHDGVDADGDGHADELLGGDDCDDHDATTWPGANDLIDSYHKDKNCDHVDGVDHDGDGSASKPSGGKDCDDEDSTVYPGAVDHVGVNGDTNCDSVDGVDDDHDGYASEGSGGTDCADGNAATHPGAPDKIDVLHVDLNCDGVDGIDADGDGHASAAEDVSGDDCDDGDAAMHPGALDKVDALQVDLNCDGVDGIDDDGDGHASVSSGGDDCRDDLTNAYPGAVDPIDTYELDTNCDGVDGVDGDGDGYAADPDGQDPKPTDCDDGDPLINPAAIERCNEVDDDCDGLVDAADVDDLAADESDEPGLKPLCELQAGVCAGCTKPASRCVTGIWWPCSATYYRAYAGNFDVIAETYCDGLDTDCDGVTDEHFSLTLPDGTTVTGAGLPCGVGACAGGVTVCGPTLESMVCPTVALATTEVCNGVDDDCDGAADEDFPGVDSDGITPLGPKGSACGIGVCAGGVVECVGDQGARTCSTTDAYLPEVCDGLDNDCDGLTDADDPVDLDRQDRRLCEKQTGVCKGSSKPASLCLEGAWKACGEAEYAAAASGLFHPWHETACDEIDNDCDGFTDEDFSLTLLDGAVVSGAKKACGVGACSGGTTVCSVDGLSMVCDREALRGDEVCDEVDNDCDGKTDAGDADLIRVPCERQAGVCAGAVHPAGFCVDGQWSSCDDGVYGAYASAFEPESEVSCDDRDNDCDGSVDEDFELIDLDGTQVPGVNRACGKGKCSGGTTTCVAGGTGTECTSHWKASRELCNGIDDDCDGATDAADPSDLVAHDLRKCANQIGVCAGARPLPVRCVSGQWLECSDPDFQAYSEDFEAGAEASCDGLDNDCDGSSDEDFSLTMPDGSVVRMLGESCGTGTCGGGEVDCADDGDGLVCSTTALASPEDCNGLDDDCDGKTDQADPDLALVPCELSEGVCAGLAKDPEECVGGVWPECPAAAYVTHSPDFEPVEDGACDGLDNDCDGHVDEAYSYAGSGGPLVGSGQPCGEGACEGGLTRCSSSFDGLECSTDALRQAEACNRIDDDCDGLTDDYAGEFAAPEVVALGSGPLVVVGPDVSGSERVAMIETRVDGLRLRLAERVQEDNSWSITTVPTASSLAGQIALASGTQGSVYLAFFGVEPSRVRVATRVSSWSISTLSYDVDVAGPLRTRVAEDGTLHFLFSGGAADAMSLMHATKVGATWSVPVAVAPSLAPSATCAELALSGAGEPSVLVEDTAGAGLFFVKRTPGGEWSEETIGPAVGMKACSLALAADGGVRAHAVTDDGILEFVKRPDGTWSTRLVEVHQVGGVSAARLTVQPDGVTAATYVDLAGGVRIATDASYGEWSTSGALPYLSADAWVVRSSSPRGSLILLDVARSKLEWAAQVCEP